MYSVTMDFETRSPVDLKTRGTFVYANHPLTEIMCLTMCVDSHEPLIWIPDKFRDKIDESKLEYEYVPINYIIDKVMAAGEVYAFNSMFEYVIWNRVGKRIGWPSLHLPRTHDIMAQCAYHSLPLSMGNACKALGLPVEKDDVGHKVMLKLCKPKAPTKAEKEQMYNQGAEETEHKNVWYHSASDSTFCMWHENPEDLIKLFNYGGTDTKAERQLHLAMEPLPEKERQVWLLDQKINLRGVHIDKEAVQDVVDLVKSKENEQLQVFHGAVAGAVNTPRSYVKLREWVNQELLGTGIGPVNSVDGNATEELLKQENLPENVRTALSAKAQLSKASVAKFGAMLNRLDTDGRLKGMFQYGGAGTLRWAGRAVQLHNLPRDSYDESDWDHVAILAKARDIYGIELLYDSMFFVASRMVRGAICAEEGKQLVCADFSSVEGRGLAFLAHEHTALEVYRNGLDPYKVAASAIFNVPYDEVTKDQRAVGKVSELAFGYCGGIGAYASMASGYGFDLETLPAIILGGSVSHDEYKAANKTARGYLRKHPGAMSLDAAISCDIIKQRWRKDRPRTVALWSGIEAAALAAVQNPGQIFHYGMIKYVVHNGFLKCLLPSGRIMHYFFPDVRLMKKHVIDTEGHGKRCMCDECARFETSLSYMGVKTVEGKTTSQWTRIATYGGKLVENIVQAFCRDLLAEAMLRLDDAGYDLVAHVHDEAVSEEEQGDLDRFCNIMAMVPPWAKGMPLGADGWIGKRYRK